LNFNFYIVVKIKPGGIDKIINIFLGAWLLLDLEIAGNIFKNFVRKLEQFEMHLITGAIFHGGITGQGAGPRCNNVVVALLSCCGTAK